jgi:hypothetical protein
MSYVSSIKRATDSARPLSTRVASFRSAVHASTARRRGWGRACELYLGPDWKTAATEQDLARALRLLAADRRAWQAYSDELAAIRREEKRRGRRHPGRAWHRLR